MYHAIVRKRIASVFAHLDQGDYEYALSGIGTTIKHQFSSHQANVSLLHSVGGMVQLFLLPVQIWLNVKLSSVLEDWWHNACLYYLPDHRTPILPGTGKPPTCS